MKCSLTRAIADQVDSLSRWGGSIVEYATREQARNAVATLSNSPWLEEFDTMGLALVVFVIFFCFLLLFPAHFAANEGSCSFSR